MSFTSVILGFPSQPLEPYDRTSLRNPDLPWQRTNDV